MVKKKESVAKKVEKAVKEIPRKVKKAVKKMPEKAEKAVEKAVKKMPEKAEKAVEKTAEKAEEIAGKVVGRISHYFDNIGVAVVELTDKLKVGEKIRVKGATTDFEQKVESMQVEHDQVKEAKKGQAIGMKVKGKVRGNDKVYVVK